MSAAVGLTTLTVTVRNPRNPRRAVVEEMLVDSGAIYAVVPAATLRRLGIRPKRQESFTMIDGTHIARDVGIALFELEGREGASKVIFGRRGDAAVIGAITLEELGLLLDPLRRELRPLRMLLA